MRRKSKLESGYAFKLVSSKNWKKAPDDDWEIVMVGEWTSHPIGSRQVDGSRVTVFQTGYGIFAQQ